MREDGNALSRQKIPETHPDNGTVKHGARAQVWQVHATKDARLFTFRGAEGDAPKRSGDVTANRTRRHHLPPGHDHHHHRLPPGLAAPDGFTTRTTRRPRRTLAGPVGGEWGAVAVAPAAGYTNYLRATGNAEEFFAVE